MGRNGRRGAGRGAGGREEAVREGRKAGWQGTWGQPRRRGRLPKEASETLDGRTVAEDKAGGWAAGQVKTEAGQLAVVLPLPWLFGQGMDNFPLSTLH